MQEYTLQFRSRITRRTSHEMILMLAKHTDHITEVKFSTDADVKRFLARQGIDFHELVEQSRDFKRKVPHLENLIGSTWKVAGGGTAALVDTQTGEKKFEVQAPGTFTFSTYLGHFEEAYSARDRAVETASFSKFQGSIVKGIASIEAYINYRAELWNKNNPNDQLIDSPTNKISFNDKIDLWIPKMTQGKKLDKSIRNWNDFIELRKTRDHLAIHPKSVGYGLSYANLAQKINLFRTGIGGILIQLHLRFGENIPSKIIRAFYSPDVEVVEITS